MPIRNAPRGAPRLISRLNLQLQQICLGRTIDILWAFVDASAHASVRGAASVEGSAKPRGNVLRENAPKQFRSNRRLCCAETA